MSIRLDRLQRGLYRMFTGIAASVLWAHQEVPRELLGATMLKLQLLGGPSRWVRTHAYGTILLPADSVIVAVTAATVGTRNIVRLNGYDYYRDTQAGDTVTDIRDELLADIQSGEADAVTATEDGDDGILLKAAYLGGLRRLQLLGELTDSDSAVFSGDAVLETIGTCTHLVGIQAFSQATEPRDGATGIIDAALDATRSFAKLEELHRDGVGIWERGEVVPLDDIAGAHWQTRSAFDLTVSAQTVQLEEVEQIESVAATIAIGAGSVTVSASQP